MARYFSTLKRPKFKPSRNSITTNNQYILKLLGFRDFSISTRKIVIDQINQLTRQLNKPLIIFRELLLYLERSNIVFPEYSTLQDILGKAMIAEEERL